MIVQIYEIQDAKEAEKCIELGVDHIGSVLLSRDSWRVPSLKEAICLTKGAAAKNCLIPLFKDPDILYSALDYYQPHFIHFCETLTDPNGRIKDMHEIVRLQSELKQKFPEISIMRSIPVPQEGILPHFPSLKIAHLLEPVSDIFLTDTWLGKEPFKGFIGLTGKRVDLKIAKMLVLHSAIPVILAGGLSPENVNESLLETAPAGADSCTQTNMVDGNGRPTRFKKDFHKVKNFVKEVRRAEEEIS